MLQEVLNMVKSIAAMSVIAMLLEYLMPEGGLQKSIRIIIGLVFLVVITQPLIKLVGIA